jgi:hypothetical protein
MGVFETPPFDRGTLGVAPALVEATGAGATTIVGGGDSAAAIAQAGLEDRSRTSPPAAARRSSSSKGKDLPGVAALDAALGARMLKPIFAANWKMNHGPPTPARSPAFLHHRRARRPHGVFFPPRHAPRVRSAGVRPPGDPRGVAERPTTSRPALHRRDLAGMARDAGARVVLVGHSERRHVFGETDEQTGREGASCVGRLTRCSASARRSRTARPGAPRRSCSASSRRV